MLQRYSMEKGYVLDAKKDLRALSSNAIALWGTMDAMYQMQYRHRAAGVSAGHRHRHHYLFAASHDEPRHLSVLERYRVEQTIAGFWEYIELWFNDANAPNMTQVQNYHERAVALLSWLARARARG